MKVSQNISFKDAVYADPYVYQNKNGGNRLRSWKNNQTSERNTFIMRILSLLLFSVIVISLFLYKYSPSVEQEIDDHDNNKNRSRIKEDEHWSVVWLIVYIIFCKIAIVNVVQYKV